MGLADKKHTYVQQFLKWAWPIKSTHMYNNFLSGLGHSPKFDPRGEGGRLRWCTSINTNHPFFPADFPGITLFTVIPRRLISLSSSSQSISFPRLMKILFLSASRYTLVYLPCNPRLVIYFVVRLFSCNGFTCNPSYILLSLGVFKL